MSLVTTALLKSALQIGHSTQDTWIEFLRNGAESFLEKELGLFFPADEAASDITEDISAGDMSDASRRYWYDSGADDLVLIPSRRPVLTLDSVTDLIDDTTIDCVLEGDMIVKASGTSGARFAGFAPGVKRYRCVYDAGYTPDTVPGAILQAVVMLVVRAYEARAGESGGGSAGESKSFAPMMQSDILALVRPFSRKSMVRV